MDFEKERKRGEYLFVAFLFDGFYEEPPTINNENARYNRNNRAQKGSY